MFERKSGIILIAGIGFFALAFLSNAVVPVLMYQHMPEKSVKELINGNLRYQFEDLAQRFPEAFEKAYGQPPADPEQASTWYNDHCESALRLGHQIYVGEGCWHCHSQFVRPVSNEDRRWGPVSTSWEYQNELQRPVMFGTRRVGPDLCREGGRRSSDWQAVHLFNPEARGRYKLETLWKDSEQISLNKMLGLPEKKAPAKVEKKVAVVVENKPAPKPVKKAAKVAVKKSPVKVKVKVKAKAALKPKIKAKVKPKAKAKVKTKVKPAAKVKPKAKVKAKVKPAVKVKPASKKKKR